jgi:hypothetical protein
MTTSDTNPSAVQNGDSLHVAHNDAPIKKTDTAFPDRKHALNGANGAIHTPHEINGASVAKVTCHNCICLL